MTSKGFSFIDVLIGTVLVLIVFMGLFGAYQLAGKVVSQSKNKITATAIAASEIEKIKNLSYESIGIIDGSLPTAQGILTPSDSIFFNNQEYSITRDIQYISDQADGLAEEDECDLDYKRVDIIVSWSRRFSGKVKATADIAPKNKFEEIASCQAQPGGILSVKVFDSFGKMIDSPLIEVNGNSYLPVSGEKDIPLATSTYQVFVSKTGYSSDRTYGVDEIAVPTKPNPIILEKQITTISFSIDKMSSFSIDTLSPWGEDFWSDSFQNTTKISEMENIVVNNNQAKLASATEGYYSTGFLVSVVIEPTDLLSWQEFVFSDLKPVATDLKYQIYYNDDVDWVLVPDSILSGNVVGFNESPVDLSGLATTTYSSLKIKANFSTVDAEQSSILNDWQISWVNLEATPIANVSFSLQGAKLIGYDGDENPVYKYATTTTTNSSGYKDLSNLESDNYIFSIDPAIGLSLIGTDPQPQPIGLAADTNLLIKLYLESENSFLISVQDDETLEPIFSAQVRLFNTGLNYDQTFYTNEKGQILFIPLTNATYNLEITALGCADYSGQVFVSGNTIKTVGIERLE